MVRRLSNAPVDKTTDFEYGVELKKKKNGKENSTHRSSHFNSETAEGYTNRSNLGNKLALNNNIVHMYGSRMHRRANTQFKDSRTHEKN